MSSPRNNARSRQIPKQERSRAAVAAIQEATLLVILADGFGGLTTNAIAERAGVGIASIYRYFTNKGSIVASLTRNAGSELLANPRACELFAKLDIETRIRFGFVGAIADQAEMIDVASELSMRFERSVRVNDGSIERRDLRFWQFVVDLERPSDLANTRSIDDSAAEFLWATEVGFLSILLSHDATRAEDASILDRVVTVGMACLSGDSCSES